MTAIVIVYEAYMMRELMDDWMITFHLRFPVLWVFGNKWDNLMFRYFIHVLESGLESLDS